MPNWEALGAATDPPVPEKDLKKIVPALESMVTALRKHQSAIPVDALMWTGPEDSE